MDDEPKPESRRTFMLFGHDVSPEDIAAALNAERARQLRLLKEDSREPGDVDGDGASTAET